MLVGCAEKHKRVEALIKRWTMHSLEPTFKAWRLFSRQRKEYKQDVMTRMLNRLEHAGAWVRFSDLVIELLTGRCS